MKWKNELHRGRIILILLGIVLLFSNHAAAQGTAKQDDVFYYDGSNIKEYKGEHTFVLVKDITKRNYLENYSKELASVTKVVFSSGCTFVPEGELIAFLNMKEIVLSENVKDYIDEGNEATIYNPSYWKRYGIYHYHGNSGKSLERFVVDENNPYLKSVDGILYDKGIKTLIKYPINSPIENYIVPDTVTKVAADGSFLYVNNMKSLTIGANTKLRLQDTAVRNYGKNFKNLKTINVAKKNPYYCVVDGVLYNKSKTAILCWPAKKKVATAKFPSTLKSLCTDVIPGKVKNLILPKSLKTLIFHELLPHVNYSDEGVLSMNALEKISVEKGNKYFITYDGALYNNNKSYCYGLPMCSKKTKWKISDAAKEVHTAYYGQQHLKQIEIGKNLSLDELYYDYTWNDPNNLTKLPKLESYKVDKKNKWLSAEKGILYNKKKTKLLDYPIEKKDTSYRVPDTVKGKGKSTVFDNIHLKKITLGKSVTKNFLGCSLPKLESISVVKGNKSFTSVDGILYDKKVTRLCYYPQNKKGDSYRMPKTVTRFDFLETNFTIVNSRIKTLCFNNKVKSVDHWLRTLSLEKIVVPKDNPYFTSIDGVLFDKKCKTLLLYPTCKKNKKYSVPNTVNLIKYNPRLFI